jgi:DNA recombination protein RmuC
MDPIIYIAIGLILVILVILIVSQLQKRQKTGTPTMALVSADLYQSVQYHNAQLQQHLEHKELEIRGLSNQIAASKQENAHYQERIKNHKAEVEAMQSQMAMQFEQLANKMLEEKGKTLTEHHEIQLGTLLSPLKTKIREFQEDIDRKFLEEAKDKVSIRKELESLRDLNRQLSQDAVNLTSALKGQSKVQGDWGEYQLELILEKAGLLKGVHFETQISYLDENGHQKRPDFIVQLPEEKHLIIDAKVSLTAFEKYHNATDPDLRKLHLKAHIESMRRHIDQLSKKKYTHLDQLTSPDYLLLFVPIEGALSSATLADPDLYIDALERNIVIVSTSSLVATMRTVSHIWKQEKQAKSVQEIARQSGLLYDKFVGFVEDIKAIGQKLDSAQSAWHDAYNKLSNSPKYGDTLIGRAERIRSLGARNSKILPSELIHLSEDDEMIKSENH